MKKSVLFFGFILMMNMTYSQDSGSLKARIAEKETVFQQTANTSRQLHNTMKEELKELYVLYKKEIETELDRLSDKNLIPAKKEELQRITEKIQNYSLER
ncbi:MAG: hypothetical protein BGO87_03085 [Flavobacteriia bacterium 40-80]|nr:MAG: hypothetical protein BGO87_03085 [Flavobacteriia bacterium 40-80]